MAGFEWQKGKREMLDDREFGRTVVITPHPDDEVLGAGGTIARIADRRSDVFVVVVTTGKPPTFSTESIERVRNEAKAAHDQLGVRDTIWLDHPAAQLSEVPHADLNASIGRLVSELKPKTLLVPFVGDIHLDHQLIFLSSLVAARPKEPRFPTTVLAYETLSETNWNAPYLSPSFAPNVFIDVTETIEKKISAMEMFVSQLRPAPHERSVTALRALATLRGATVHRKAAEAFVLIRQVLS